jgi:predicted GNAT family acetyltransferase
MAELTDNPARSRFEMAVEGDVAFVNYVQRDADTIDLLYARVPSALSGRGVGSRLAHAVLEEVRRRGQRAIPSCGFIAAYARRHPEFRDVLK